MSTNEVDDGAAWLASIQRRVEALRELLDKQGLGEDQREPIRAELVAVTREIDSGLADLQSLRESMRPLAESYRRSFARPAEGHGPRIDHLGASSWRERGWSSLAAGELGESVRFFEEALKLDPGDLSARALLAWAKLETGEGEEARRLLDRLFAADADHELGLVVHALVTLRAGEPEEAIAILDRLPATADRTARLYALLHRGLAFADRRMYREAQSSFRAALELGPNLTQAYWELGRSHEAEGRLELALAAWGAGAQNRFNRWGERCRAELERREGESSLPS